MSAFHRVLKLAKKWQPQVLPSETKYRDSLAAYLREHMPTAATIEKEYRHLGTTIDIYVRQPGFLGSSTVFVELKRNFCSKTQHDRLVGQIESLEPKRNFVIVVLCEDRNPALVSRLREKYQCHEDFAVMSKVQILEKGSLEAKDDSPLGKRKEGGQVSAQLDLHKRRIQETRMANNLYPELRLLRNFFLQYNLADAIVGNRSFFDKWLTDPVVEMGWAPAGAWSQKRISDLFGDLDTVTVSAGRRP